MRTFSIPLPGARRLHLGLERHGAHHSAGLTMGTSLRADLFRRGRWQGFRMLGSGLITNVGVLALTNDFAWAQDCQTLKLANQHATGTGAAASSASNIKLQTLSTQGGQNPIAGTQTLISAPNLQKYRTAAQISYSGTEAVTEWGLHTHATLSAATGSPATATSASSVTATGTPFTPSSGTVRGETQKIVEFTVTPAWGIITSNTNSTLTVPAWYKTADGTASATPGGTEAYVIRPVMFDRKVFAAVNVEAGDAILFTYDLTISSGG